MLNLVNATHTNTGKTEIWAGTLNFDGTLAASPVTLHRHTTLNSDGGGFPAGITMEYGATLNVGGAASGKVGTVQAGTLSMGYGARVVLDYNGTDNTQHDWLNATTLVAGIAALVVIGLCTWTLFREAVGPAAGPNDLASFHSDTDYRR